MRILKHLRKAGTPRKDGFSLRSLLSCIILVSLLQLSLSTVNVLCHPVSSKESNSPQNVLVLQASVFTDTFYATRTSSSSLDFSVESAQGINPWFREMMFSKEYALASLHTSFIFCAQHKSINLRI
jgi:hypothetical protein